MEGFGDIDCAGVLLGCWGNGCEWSEHSASQSVQRQAGGCSGSRAALCAVLRLLANSVHVACKGDPAMLTSSGFPVWKPTRTPVGVLPTPATPVLSLGARTGELNASTPPMPNAYIYNWRVALASAPDAYVLQQQATAASDAFEGLTPGQIYLVDVNAVGSAGPSDWSDTAQQMVL